MENCQINSVLENSIALHSENNMNGATTVAHEISAEFQRQIEDILEVL